MGATAINVFGATSSIVTNPGGALGNINLVAQLAATGASEAAALRPNPLTSTSSILANGVAFSTGIATLANDIHVSKDQLIIGADLLSLVGNTISVVGAIAEETNTIPGVSVGAVCEQIGTYATFVGAAMQDYDAAQGFLANSPTLRAFINGSDSLFNQLTTLITSLTAGFNNSEAALSTAWAEAEQSLSVTFAAVANSENDIGGSNFYTAAASASSDLNSTLATLSI